MIIHIPMVRGIEKCSERCLLDFAMVCLDRDIDPGFMAAVISFESGWKPSAVNPASGAAGLIQITKKNARDLGTTAGELATMSRVKQMPFVASYLDSIHGWLGRWPDTLCDTYLYIFAPAHVGHGPDHVVYSSPNRSYTQNASLDRDNSGTITTAEACASVQGIYEAGLARGSVAVDLSAQGIDEGDDEGPGVADALGAGLLLLGVFEAIRRASRA